MQQARAVVAEEFAAVNRLIIDKLHSSVPLVENIGHYIVDAGGKRLRPTLVLLTGGACSKLNSHQISLAAIIEFIHTATLLHDDVVDISSLRRGRPTANATWGNASSVLVGDFLYTRAFQLMVALGNMEVMTLLADVTNAIAEGEVLQLTKAGDPNTSEEDYFQVIKNKTAVLFAAATAGSAMLAGCNKALTDQLYNYGLHLGFAFQLIDDVLDYEGDVDELGKNIGDDLCEGKPTLPLIYVLKNGTSEQQALVRQAITNKSKDNIEAVCTAVSASGALDYTRQQAIDHSQKAKLFISELPDSVYKSTLSRLTDVAVSRRT
jgi:octaprenyl-diphosphate synthase